MNDAASLLASDHGLQLNDASDALDAMALGLPGCIFEETDLHPRFFDFQNGLAGEIMQKFVNYGFRVAFVIAPDHAHGPRLDELMIDHRNHPVIRFFADTGAAAGWLAD